MISGDHRDFSKSFLSSSGERSEQDKRLSDKRLRGRTDSKISGSRARNASRTVRTNGANQTNVFGNVSGNVSTTDCRAVQTNQKENIFGNEPIRTVRLSNLDPAFAQKSNEEKAKRNLGYNLTEVQIERKLTQVKQKADWNLKYQTYLISPEWAKLRSQVRTRCKNLCEKCKVRRVEAIHHKTYVRLGNERLEDLLGVCRKCHEKIHGIRSQHVVPLVFGGGF